MIFIKGNKISINGKEIEFRDEVQSFLEIGDILVVYCNPKFSDKKMWDYSWKKNDGKNVFALSKLGQKIWTFDQASTGIASIDSFWIKSSEKYNGDSAFWVTTSQFAYLILVNGFKVAQKVNTYILK